MYYGVFVVGSPGSGKTTLCKVLQTHMGGRKTKIVCFDPLGKETEDAGTWSIRKHIRMRDLMEELDLGPNGAIIRAMHVLLENIDQYVEEFREDDAFYIFDLPGQPEIVTVHDVCYRLVRRLEDLGFHLCVVNLADITYALTPEKYAFTLMSFLRSMIMLGLPHINVISKIDLVLEFPAEYADAFRFERPSDGSVLARLYRLVDEYCLVGHEFYSATDAETVAFLADLVDLTTGYCALLSDIDPHAACAVDTEERKNSIIEKYFPV